MYNFEYKIFVIHYVNNIFVINCVISFVEKFKFKDNFYINKKIRLNDTLFYDSHNHTNTYTLTRHKYIIVLILSIM